MKRVFYSVLCLCLIILTFTSCLSSKIERNSTSKAYRTLNFKEDLDYLKTDISYPEFNNYPELSKRVKNTIFSNWESFKSYTKNDWHQINELNARDSKSSLPPYEYIVKTQIETSSPKYISVLINSYVYNGGAHGNTTLISYNYNINTGKYENILTVTGMDMIKQIFSPYLNAIVTTTVFELYNTVMKYIYNNLLYVHIFKLCYDKTEADYE